MKSTFSPIKKIVFLLLIGFLFFILAWVVISEAKDSVYGGEFFIQWSSGRLVAFENKNPYTIPHSLQNIFPNQASTRQYPELLNTPLYSLVLIFPFMLIENFQLAFYIWLIFNIFCAYVLMVSIFQFVEMEQSWLIVIPVILYLGFSFNSFQAFISGSLIVSTSVFLILSLLALKTGKNELAGIFLAFTTIQPQYFLLIYILAVIWGISSRKWGYIIWFLAGIFILTVVGVFVIPGWILDYIRVLLNNNVNSLTWTPGEVLLSWLPGIGKQLGWAFTFSMIVILLFEWFAVRKKEIRWYYWTVCLTIAASQLIGLAGNLSGQFILTIPILLILSIWVERAHHGQRIMILAVIFFLAIEWLISQRAGFNQALKPAASLYFLLPLVTLAGIFWVRWWAIRPGRLYIEELRKNENG